MVVKNKRVVDFLVVVSYDGSGVMIVPILSVTVEANVVTSGSESRRKHTGRLESSSLADGAWSDLGYDIISDSNRG